jgi:hypothetical protein
VVDYLNWFPALVNADAPHDASMRQRKLVIFSRVKDKVRIRDMRDLVPKHMIENIDVNVARLVTKKFCDVGLEVWKPRIIEGPLVQTAQQISKPNTGYQRRKVCVTPLLFSHTYCQILAEGAHTVS